MGLANIELKRGAAPTSESITSAITKKSTTEEAIDLEESIFAFSKAPDEQIGRVAKGGSTRRESKSGTAANRKQRSRHRFVRRQGIGFRRAEESGARRQDSGLTVHAQNRRLLGRFPD